jgi:copper chaperone
MLCTLTGTTQHRFLSNFIASEDFSVNQNFTVTGMTCGHCEKAVTRAVKQLDPEAEVTIDRNANKVQVKSEQPRDAIAHAIAEEGYVVAA